MLRNYVNPKLTSKPNITSYLYSLYFKRGSASGGREEGRAHSTAEEFRRQGVGSQTVEKTSDGAMAAVTDKLSGDSEVDTEKVKEEIKPDEGFCPKKGNDDDDDDDDGMPINTMKGV